MKEKLHRQNFTKLPNSLNTRRSTLRRLMKLRLTNLWLAAKLTVKLPCRLQTRVKYRWSIPANSQLRKKSLLPKRENNDGTLA